MEHSFSFRRSARGRTAIGLCKRTANVRPFVPARAAALLLSAYTHPTGWEEVRDAL